MVAKRLQELVLAAALTRESTEPSRVHEQTTSLGPTWIRDGPAFDPSYAGGLLTYPTPDNVGWSEPLNLSGPLIKLPLPDKTHAVLPENDACEHIEAMIDDIGLNGAAEFSAVVNWHKVAQLCTDRAMSEGQDIAALAKTMIALSMASKKFILNGGSFGLWHGLSWWQLGVADAFAPGNFTWAHALATLCPGGAHNTWLFHHNCLHGFGHGFWIRSTQRGRYGRCDWMGSHPINVDDQMQGYDACRSAATIGMTQNCLHGFFHAMTESVFDFGALNYRAPNDWRFPCDRYDLPHHCFFWAVNNQPVKKYKPYDFNSSEWRAPLFEKAGRVEDWCYVPPIMKESTIVGCIWGVSAGLFPAFDRLTIFTPEKPIAPSRAVCNETQAMIPYFAFFWPPFCHFLFKHGPAALIHRQSNTTLVDWCSVFVDPTAISGEVEQRRWLACIHGSTGGFFPAMMAEADHLAFGARYDVKAQAHNLCDQLLGVWWQPESLRARSHRVCVEAFPVRLSPQNQTWAMDSALYEEHRVPGAYEGQ